MKGMTRIFFNLRNPRYLWKSVVQIVHLHGLVINKDFYTR
ncbi:Uncharacterized protein dnm_007120 [Desulfonema magnum]|uniref:Uncharacterized protein n=1 Tax=Desulfonema magnum TaxID=45655 RepID=A0A975BG71_9BACT|nr:Uncharacterized protein dnm_007120 [Desulfonema magnum]